MKAQNLLYVAIAGAIIVILFELSKIIKTGYMDNTDFQLSVMVIIISIVMLIKLKKNEKSNSSKMDTGFRRYDD